MIRLEKRPTPSRAWAWGTPFLAVALTMIAGGLLFAGLGKDPFAVVRTIFWDPLFGEFAWYLRGQLLVKAGPLTLIAVGLGGLCGVYLGARCQKHVPAFALKALLAAVLLFTALRYLGQGV